LSSPVDQIPAPSPEERERINNTLSQVFHAGGSQTRPALAEPQLSRHLALVERLQTV
jgi:hypothetical protein